MGLFGWRRGRRSRCATSPEAEVIDDAQLKPALREALALARIGQNARAEATLAQLHEARPDSAETALSLARLLLQRGQRAQGESALVRTLRHQVSHELLAVELAALRAGGSDMRAAVAGLQEFVAHT